jgi:hypothetical protein
VLLAEDKTIRVGAALAARGRLGTFPSGITRLLVAGPDGATICLQRQRFPWNKSCQQEYEALTTPQPKDRSLRLVYEMPRAHGSNFGELSPECNPARSFLKFTWTRIVKLRLLGCWENNPQSAGPYPLESHLSAGNEPASLTPKQCGDIDYRKEFCKCWVSLSTLLMNILQAALTPNSIV